MDGGDPRVSKPRLPKPYTEEQLVFLRSHISGFETRTRGHVRGDAKKFALDRASEFLVRFGLPPDLLGVEEAEPRFREQIYNWYKNTVGRARRKLEGRTRSKRSEKTSVPGITWTPTGPISYVPSSDQPSTSTQPQSQSQSQSPPQPQLNPGPGSGPSTQLQFTFQSSSLPVPIASTVALNVTTSALREAFITPAIDAPTLSSLIQSYVLAHPSATSLLPVISSLFDAATQLLGRSAAGGTGPHGHGHDREQLFALLRRFVDACAFFPSSLVHADMSGPLAGPRALQIALRKASVWAPVSSPFFSSSSSSPPPSAFTLAGAGHGSISDEMERIAADRQRRKEYVQWAQIHAAAIELGILPSSAPSPLSSPTTSNIGVVGVGVSVGAGGGVGGVGVGVNSGPTYHHPGPSSDMSAYGVPPPQPQSQSQSPRSHAHGHPHSHPHTHPHSHTHSHPQVQPQAPAQPHHPHSHPTNSTATLSFSFSEAMARDAVWEPDEVEWVAGIIVLRAIIRTSHPSRASAGVGVRGGRNLKVEYEHLLGTYERRWKEIKDEARQAIVTEVLLGAREDLARMDDTRVT